MSLKRVEGNEARITRVNRTQNTFEIEVEASRPSRILLNSNFERGWKTDLGTVVETQKLLAVDVPEGHHHFFVRYWPHGFSVGLILFPLALLRDVALRARVRVRADA
jgi:uncharacterized membrane protein YfhO